MATKAPVAETFSPWLKFEPAAAGQAIFKDRFMDAVLGHQVFQIPPQGLPPRDRTEFA